MHAAHRANPRQDMVVCICTIMYIYLVCTYIYDYTYILGFGTAQINGIY